MNGHGVSPTVPQTRPKEEECKPTILGWLEADGPDHKLAISINNNNNIVKLLIYVTMTCILLLTLG